MKTVTLNVKGISQCQWSSFLLELNLMKKAWRPYGVEVDLKAHSIKRIIAQGTSNGESTKKKQTKPQIIGTELKIRITKNYGIN